MHVNDFFNWAYCISLERRRFDWKHPKTGITIEGKERLFSSEFKKHKISVEISDGVDGLLLDLPSMRSSDGTQVSRGDIGCVMSHLNVVKNAKAHHLKSYVVFEDDIELSPDFTEKFAEYIKEVPRNWDMIYLGGSHMEPPVQVSEHIFRISNTFTTHAIGIKNTVYDDLIEIWEKGNEKVDISLSSLHKRYNCYVMRPHIAFQRPGYSDILEKEANYEHLRK